MVQLTAIVLPLRAYIYGRTSMRMSSVGVQDKTAMTRTSDIPSLTSVKVLATVQGNRFNYLILR